MAPTDVLVNVIDEPTQGEVLFVKKSASGLQLGEPKILATVTVDELAGQTPFVTVHTDVTVWLLTTCKLALAVVVEEILPNPVEQKVQAPLPTVGTFADKAVKLLQIC